MRYSLSVNFWIYDNQEPMWMNNASVVERLNELEAEKQHILAENVRLYEVIGRNEVQLTQARHSRLTGGDDERTIDDLKNGLREAIEAIDRNLGPDWNNELLARLRKLTGQ